VPQKTTNRQKNVSKSSRSAAVGISGDSQSILTELTAVTINKVNKLLFSHKNARDKATAFVKVGGVKDFWVAAKIKDLPEFYCSLHPDSISIQNLTAGEKSKFPIETFFARSAVKTGGRMQNGYDAMCGNNVYVHYDGKKLVEEVREIKEVTLQILIAMFSRKIRK
jgi:hypothetical protein